MDRAGLVGADGATHCGAFDVTFMASLPSMVTMAPSNEAELIHMVATAAAIDDRPSCFRFPRGNGLGIDLAAEGIGKDLKGTPLEVGWCGMRAWLLLMHLQYIHRRSHSQLAQLTLRFAQQWPQLTPHSEPQA